MSYFPRVWTLSCVPTFFAVLPRKKPSIIMGPEGNGCKGAQQRVIERREKWTVTLLLFFIGSPYNVDCCPSFQPFTTLKVAPYMGEHRLGQCPLLKIE